MCICEGQDSLDITLPEIAQAQKQYILFFHFHRGAIAPRTPHPAHLENIQPGEKILYGPYGPYLSCIPENVYSSYAEGRLLYSVMLAGSLELYQLRFSRNLSKLHQSE